MVTRLKGRQKQVWVWTEIDAHTKVLLALHVGRRTCDDGYARVHEVGFTGKVQTAQVERLPLTLRDLVAPLSRRTWSVAQSPALLRSHLEWRRADYHFARYHNSLCLAGRGSRRSRSQTPAMAAGVTCHQSSVQGLLQRPLPMI